MKDEPMAIFLKTRASASRAFALFLLLWLFAPPLAHAETGEPSLPAPKEESSDAYRVGPDDVLAIRVFENDDLSGDYAVASDGAIVFPLIGKVEIAGLTILRVTEVIQYLLEADYIQHPIVSVTVKEFRSRKVRILGNVGKPGIYYLTGPTKIFDLLSMAEGISPQLGSVMSGQKAHIVRQLADSGSVKVETLYVDLYELLIQGKEDVNILLENGDVIYIPETQSVHVVGEVKKPGTFPYEEGMTVLKAITLAGGATTRASVRNTFIKRIRDGKELRIQSGMGDLLMPDDIVEVPLSFW